MYSNLIDDNYIIELCFQKNTSKLNKKFDFSKLNLDVQKYILNRFDDSLSIKETLIRIYNHIELHPKCPICGNLVKFGKCGNSKFFHQTCGNSKCIYKLNYQHNKQKYGYGNPWENDLVKEKIKNTNLLKYGVEHVLQNENIHNRQKQTCINKFGKENIFETKIFQEKFKNTMMNKYGVEHPMYSEKIKNKFNWSESVKKQIQTKRQNHTFNISKKEQKSYLIIKEKYPDIDYQYKSEKYPFYCDFYIPSLDLYIECNYHWTHGGHPFDPNNSDDLKIVELWAKKNTKYYNNAINCWTIRDVNKRNIAKQNQLNYIEFWDIQELIKWIKK